MITTLIFDLDNTLIDRNSAIAKVHQRIVDEDFPDITAEARSSMLELFRQWDYFGYTPHEVTLRKYIKTFDANRSIPETVQMIRDTQGLHATLLPDAQEVLTTLSQKYTLGIITNGPSDAQRLKLHTALGDLSHLFKVITVSGDKNIHKPQPQIYSETLEALHVSPQDCVFIGDDLINDVDAPLKLGMKAIRFNFCNMFPTQRVKEISLLRDLLDIDFNTL